MNAQAHREPQMRTVERRASPPLVHYRKGKIDSVEVLCSSFMAVCQHYEKGGSGLKGAHYQKG